MKNFIITAVKDELTQTFMQPVFGESEAELIRIFKYQINNIKLWQQNASDYSFYKLGEFNDNTGVLNPMMKKLVNGVSVVEKEDKKNDILDLE